MSRWGFRVCAGCGQNLRSDEYSTNQWKNRVVGFSRCMECVEEGVDRDGTGFNTARENNSSGISVDVSEYFAEGSFRCCSEGTYVKGPRKGQLCVAKWFEDDWMAEKHIERDLDAVQKALHIITQWNQANICGGGTVIRLNCPEHWVIDGKDCLVEPYIYDFFKMNSNSGWVRSNFDDYEQKDRCEMLQALSHYSYHISSGQFLLCDLQGGLFRDGIILTDPAIMSRNSRFGVTDLGPRGISTFFYFHRCTKYCQSHWTSPRDKTPYFQRRSASTMSFGH
jgi:hypothetical protein